MLGHWCPRRRRNDIIILIDELEIVPRQQMGDSGELGTIPAGVIVELEQGDGEKFHVLRNGEDLYTNKLDTNTNDNNKKEKKRTYSSSATE